MTRTAAPPDPTAHLLSDVRTELHAVAIRLTAPEANGGVAAILAELAAETAGWQAALAAGDGYGQQGSLWDGAA